jgi:hypothetical protein
MLATTQSQLANEFAQIGIKQINQSTLEKLIQVAKTFNLSLDQIVNKWEVLALRGERLGEKVLLDEYGVDELRKMIQKVFVACFFTLEELTPDIGFGEIKSHKQSLHPKENKYWNRSNIRIDYSTSRHEN